MTSGLEIRFDIRKISDEIPEKEHLLVLKLREINAMKFSLETAATIEEFWANFSLPVDEDIGHGGFNGKGKCLD